LNHIQCNIKIWNTGEIALACLVLSAFYWYSLFPLPNFCLNRISQVVLLWCAKNQKKEGSFPLPKKVTIGSHHSCFVLFRPFTQCFFNPGKYSWTMNVNKEKFPSLHSFQHILVLLVTQTFYISNIFWFLLKIWAIAILLKWL